MPSDQPTSESASAKHREERHPITIRSQPRLRKFLRPMLPCGWILGGISSCSASRLSQRLLLLTAFCLLLTGPSCGYRVAGRGDRLPPDIKTLAIPIFVNDTPRYRIEQQLSAAVTREFIERTKFRITPKPQGADAVLRGTVKDVRAGVITFDLNTGRATSMQIQVTADVKLIDLHSKKVVFSNPNYIFREQYQVSQTTSGLFEEDQPAIERLSRDLAHTLVTEILENF
jgi:hypothetical protein